MNEVLEQTVTGEEPVTISLGGKAYPLAFPMHACALYQRETAKLDRTRRAENGPLSEGEVSALKQRRRQLLDRADAMEDEIGALPANAPHRDKLDRFYELLEEAMSLKKQLDEDGGRGDSLFLEGNWFKINTEDPERVVLALWAGLHQVEEVPGRAQPKWTAPLTLGQLQKLVDPSNAEEAIDAIGRALRSYAVKKKRNRISPSPENGATESAPRTMETASPSASLDSGPLLASISVSPKPNS